MAQPSNTATLAGICAFVDDKSQQPAPTLQCSLCSCSAGRLSQVHFATSLTDQKETMLRTNSPHSTGSTSQAPKCSRHKCRSTFSRALSNGASGFYGPSACASRPFRSAGRKARSAKQRCCPTKPPGSQKDLKGEGKNRDILSSLTPPRAFIPDANSPIRQGLRRRK